MTPTAIIREALSEGVKLTLSTAGTIKATGDDAAVGRWVAVIREHKAEIVDVLKVGAGDTTPASLTAKDETAIRAWLAHIEESDPVTIADMLAQCAADPDARTYCLKQARQIPLVPEPDHTATCGACRHFQRINHPNLGHCAKGEPEAPAGLWATDRRWCPLFSRDKQENFRP